MTPTDVVACYARGSAKHHSGHHVTKAAGRNWLNKGQSNNQPARR